MEELTTQLAAVNLENNKLVSENNSLANDLELSDKKLADNKKIILANEAAIEIHERTTNAQGVRITALETQVETGAAIHATALADALAAVAANAAATGRPVLVEQLRTLYTNNVFNNVHMAGGDKHNGVILSTEAKIEMQELAAEYKDEFDHMTQQQRYSVHDHVSNRINTAADTKAALVALLPNGIGVPVKASKGQLRTLLNLYLAVDCHRDRVATAAAAAATTA